MCSTFITVSSVLSVDGQSAAEVFLKESWSYSRSIGNRSGSTLQGPRLKTIDQAAELYAQTKEHMFERVAAEEQAKLLKYVLTSRSCVMIINFNIAW